MPFEVNFLLYHFVTIINITIIVSTIMPLSVLNFLLKMALFYQIHIC